LDSAAAEKAPAAGVTLPSSDNKSELLAYTWKMQKEGYAIETVRGNTGALRALIKRGADLADPESVKAALAIEKAWGSCRRRNVINAYSLFLKFHGLQWEPPRCNVIKKIPFIPTEQEIDDVIAGSPTMIAAFLQLLKETAMRSGEAKRLKWVDVDLERRVITLNDPEKGSLPRIFNNLSSKLLGMLNSLPRESERVFGERSLNSFKAVYQRARQRISFKLANPRLLEIHFHTLRHWKATMEYHHTKDILHVKEFLGHKEIDNTLIYISLDKKLFQNLPNDAFVTRVAHNVKEACELIETGFEFVTGEYGDGGKIFRRRK
jgi:integrase